MFCFGNILTKDPNVVIWIANASCRQRICHQDGSTSGMRAHFEARHPVQYAECHYALCHYVKWHSTKQKALLIIQNVSSSFNKWFPIRKSLKAKQVLINQVTKIVPCLSVEKPFCRHTFDLLHHFSKSWIVVQTSIRFGSTKCLSAIWFSTERPLTNKKYIFSMKSDKVAKFFIKFHFFIARLNWA
jgi:hypothetical protein